MFRQTQKDTPLAVYHLRLHRRILPTVLALAPIEGRFAELLRLRIYCVG